MSRPSIPNRYASLVIQVLALLALLFSGCSLTHPKHSERFNSYQSPDRIVLQISPTHPRQLDKTAFTVNVSDKLGNPIQHANVFATLTMPGMSMPENVAQMQASRPGVYTGSGRFTMPGAWLVTIHAWNNSGRIAPLNVRKDFSITVSP